ncbi:hypothetical protein GCM10010420_53260 [Streptomyces glaucosporus]|uniref:Uncharacterized protein n=1 Tax=Streptomyces glaucosporus TaxID=284044 RepID=A0ABN3IYI3_9ACTN
MRQASWDARTPSRSSPTPPDPAGTVPAIEAAVGFPVPVEAPDRRVRLRGRWIPARPARRGPDSGFPCGRCVWRDDRNPVLARGRTPPPRAPLCAARAHSRMSCGPDARGEHVRPPGGGGPCSGAGPAGPGGRPPYLPATGR